MRSMLREQSSLFPSARTLWEIQQAALKTPFETASNLYTDILRQAEHALSLGEARRAGVMDAASLQSYQQQIKSLFYDCIGGPPRERPASQARVTGRLHHNGFTIEKVLLSPRENTFASANVYVPCGCKGLRPAVLLSVGHTDLGKADPEYQLVAQMLAYAGFVTLVLDPVGEGERFEHYEAEIDFQPIQGCSGEHDLLDWKAKLMGLSLARYFIEDGLSALSYLASREDVDPARIALTGHSGGGTQTSMLMLAAGERLACAAPCAYVSDIRAMIECGVDPDNEMIWPGSVAKGLDYVDLLAGMAPKPILILSNQHDFFPREGTRRTVAQAQALWRAAGSQTPPEWITACSQHAYPPSLAQAVTCFFGRHLLGEEPDLSGFSFSALPAESLRCSPDGILLKAYPQMRTVFGELLDELAMCLRQQKSHDAQATRSFLKDALHMDRLFSSPDVSVCGEGICGHYAYRCLAWRPQEGYWNTGTLLRDMRRGDAPLPTVIALWPEGSARITEHSAWIHRAVREGFQILVLDLTASGALLPAPLGGSGLYIGWGTLYKLNAYLLQLGDSLFALRARQAIAAVRMLSAWPEADPSRLYFYAMGEYARLAEIASLIAGIPVCSDEAFQPYEEIVSERYHDQTYTHEWIFPGVLRVCSTRSIRQILQSMGLLTSDPTASPSSSSHA